MKKRLHLLIPIIVCCGSIFSLNAQQRYGQAKVKITYDSGRSNVLGEFGNELPGTNWYDTKNNSIWNKERYFKDELVPARFELSFLLWQMEKRFYKSDDEKIWSE